MVTRSYGLIMVAVHQDHPFDEHFKMSLDPDSRPVVFRYCESQDDQSHYRGTTMQYILSSQSFIKSWDVQRNQ
jgi:hypothetical protein